MIRGVLVQWTRKIIASWFKIFICLNSVLKLVRETTSPRWKPNGFSKKGSPPHTARETRHFLKQHFEGRFISLYDVVEWQPYSPDLTPPDFFLWGYLKDRIFGNPRPCTLDQLKENICREIRNIPQETFPKVMANMATRVQSVIGKRGVYVEHVV